MKKVTYQFNDEPEHNVIIRPRGEGKSYNDPIKKNWRVTYEVLFQGDTQPTRRVIEFHYIETAIEFIKRTERHCNLLFANLENIK